MSNTLPRRWATRARAAIGALGLAFATGGLQPAAAPPTTQTELRFDRTGNQVVNSADVVEAAEAWAAALSGGAGASGSDLNGDGAVDIADVQLVAAHVGQGTTEAAQDALNQLAATLAQELPVKGFTVNSAASGNPNSAGIADTNRGDGICVTSSGVCTLQAALQETNAPRVPAYHAWITFAIREPNGDCPALVQIMPNLDYERWLQIDDSSATASAAPARTAAT